MEKTKKNVEKEVHVKNVKPKVLPGLTKGFRRQHANCSRFIKKDGSYGKWGKIIKNNISKLSTYPYFMKPKHIKGICPKFTTFTEREKKHFWTWTLAAISWDETRCVSHRRNTHAPNGVAVGLLQLDERKGHRYWRGPGCNVRSVAGVKNNLKCGLEILGELLKGKKGFYKNSGAIFRKKKKSTSYWEKLTHPGGGSIGKLIMSYPLCK